MSLIWRSRRSYIKRNVCETALKNYTLEAVLEDSHSFVLEDIFSRTLVAYRDYPEEVKTIALL